MFIGVDSNGDIYFLDDIYRILREEKIINIGYHGEIILENGKAYEFGENDQLICINEEFDELRNEKIVNVNRDIIILENGKAYVPGPGNQLLCINDKIEELKNKKIVNVSNNLILLEDGSIYNIADNELINYNQPTLILEGKNIEKISSGYDYTVALDKNGKVYAWGRNNYGQLGDGTTTNSNIPICISDIPTNPLNKVKIKEISAGNSHAVAIDEEGKVYTWGHNYGGQLGDGTTTDSNIPICISDISGNELYNQKALKISANGYWTIIIDKNGKIYIFGRNEGAV